MAATNIQMAAITVLSGTNVWLSWWDVRWLMYYGPLSRLIPGSTPYNSIDPVLEVPGVLALLIVGYVLVYRSTFALWKHRFSSYRNELMTNALAINSVLLVILTALGLTEWLVLYGFLAPELIVVVSLGAGAALVSFYLEKRPRWPRPLPYADFRRLNPRARGSTRFPS